MLLLPTASLVLASALTWLDPTQVKAGARGVCITEWSGGEQRQIPVEVIGTLDASSPGRSTILVRLEDPLLRDSGVVAGMSGSPVYIDGQLLGAVAFGWAFAREPLAGVTPFATMHEIGAVGPPGSGVVVSPDQLRTMARGEAAPMSVLPRLASDSAQGKTLVAVSGLAIPTGFGRELLEGAGLEPVAAGTGDAGDGIPEAGQMLALPLVWGDATLAAGGTITARDGNRLWAFGHPLFSLGNIRLPAARARVLAVQGSFQNPFKIFATGQPFGTCVADRPAGVLLEAGPAPTGLPVNVWVREATGDRRWQFKVAETPMLEPLMVTFLTNACLTARGATVGESSIILKVTLAVPGEDEVTVRQSTRGPDAVARMAAFTGGLVGVVANSPFPHPALAGVTIELDRAETAVGAVIAAVTVGRSWASPGDQVPVDVTLQPNQQEPQHQRLMILVPADTPEGTLDLVVADGASWSDYRMRAEAVSPARFLDQLAQLGRFEPSTTLVAALESRDRGLAQPGVSQPSLPPSWAATLATGLVGMPVTRINTSIVATARWSAAIPLEGAFRQTLTIRPRREAQ